VRIEVKRARVMGFCFGVRRAVRLLNAAARKYGAVETLGPAVHNEKVVETLARQGVRRIDSLDAATGKVVAIPAHGAAPEVIAEITSRGLESLDVTCPIVSQAQRRAAELVENGFWVVIFGDARHPEVKGLLGWCRGRGCAVLDPAELEKHPPDGRKIGVISQTTQNTAQFIEFVKGLLDLLAPRASRIQVVNTICRETQERQRSALELAAEVELMLVLGSRTSANTRRLAELCAPLVETVLLEGPGELDASLFQGKKRVGITAGASTPDELIEETVARVKELAR